MNAKQKKIVIIGSVVAGATIVAIVLSVRKNKKKSEDASLFKIELESQVNPSSIGNDGKFNPSTIDKSAKLLNDDEAKTLAENIWDSWGWIDDDEERIYSQLRLLLNVQQLKQVSDKYIHLAGGVGLKTSLETRLSDSEFAICMSIINALPNK